MLSASRTRLGHLWQVQGGDLLHQLPCFEPHGLPWVSSVNGSHALPALPFQRLLALLELKLAPPSACLVAPLP